MDLSSFDSIKAAAKQINESCDKIDVLILNAGVSALAASTTKEGYELQFGVNHVGHALLTQLLMPKVLAASKEPGADARIVVVSSRASQNSALAKGLPLAEMKTDLASTTTLKRYSYSKLANIYFAQGLAKQYPNVTSTALHPGVVYTEIWSKVTGFGKLITYPLGLIVRMVALTAAQGARNQLWCAFAKGVQSGKYYEPVGVDVAGLPFTRNEQYRDELWEWTNKELAAHGAPGWPSP